VPEKFRVLSEDVLGGVIGIVIAVAAREDDNAELHGHSTSM
jgi:hypothetical protein